MNDETAVIDPAPVAAPVKPITAIDPLATVMQTGVMREQREAGFGLNFGMTVGQVKFFKNAREKSDRYGFVRVFKPELTDSPDGMIDVFIHAAGAYEWCCDGSDYPSIRKTDEIPQKSKLVFLDDIIPTGIDEKTGKPRYRANKWIHAATTSFERVKYEIAARPQYRMCQIENGNDPEVVWTGRSLYELAHRYPPSGQMLSYPLYANDNAARYIEREVDRDVWEICEEDPREMIR